MTDVAKILFENFKIKLLQAFNAHLVITLQKEFKEDFLATFSEEFDRQFSEIDAKMVKQGDPTAPSKIKSAVVAYISENFESGITFDQKENQVKVSLLSPEALGYPGGPGRKETDKVRLFYFYLEGTMGDLAFLSNDIYDKFNPSRAGDNLGRFGEGFLIPMSDYSKRRKNHIIGPTLPTEEEVRFPLSGAQPIDVIGIVMSKLPMKKYIDLATKKALEDLKNVG